MPLTRTDRLFTPGVDLATYDLVTGEDDGSVADEITGEDQDMHPLLWGGAFLLWGGIPMVW